MVHLGLPSIQDEYNSGDSFNLNEELLQSGSFVHQPMDNELACVDGGIRDDHTFTMRCNGRLFKILLSLTSKEHSLERQYAEKLCSAIESGDDEDYDKLEEEISDLLALLCQPLYRKYATPKTASPDLPCSLYDVLYPQVMDLRMITKNQEAALTWDSPPYVTEPEGFHSSSFILPKARPSLVQILETIREQTIFKVSVNDQIMCAKVVGDHLYARPLKREVTIMQEISQNKNTQMLRCPRLTGVITSEEDADKIVGLLMSFIETGSSGGSLYELDMNTVDTQTRAEWASQIGSHVSQLHSANIVWGDAKADNVLIDKDLRPWLLDFGGGFTDGWVSGQLQETKEGDYSGLRQIKRFLKVET